MSSENDILEAVLARVMEYPHQAVEVAHQVFRLHLTGGLDDAGVRVAVGRLHERLALTSFPDLARHVAQYAIRLATHSSELLIEELSKLFSLCEDVFVLMTIGFELQPDLESNLVQAVTARIRRQSKQAGIAAEATVEEWTSNSWWHLEVQRCNSNSSTV